METTSLQNDHAAQAIVGLIQDRNAYRHTATKLLATGETRSLTQDERKELVSVAENLQDSEKKLRSLEGRADDDDAEGVNSDLDVMGRSTGRSTGRKSRPTVPGRYTGNWGIHTKKHEYSLGRAIRCCVQGRSPDGLEGEMSQEAERRNEKNVRGLGFMMPFQTGDVEYRDSPTTTSTAAGAVTSTWSKDFLLLLRKQSIFDKLGIPVISDLRGNFIQPYETSGTTAQWVAEGSASTANAMAVSTVTGTPRQLTSRMILTRQMIASSSYELLDDLLFRDMTNSVAEQLSLALVQGQQTVNPVSPEGILYNPNVSVSTLASPPTLAWSDLLAFQTTVLNANPPEGSPLKYLISPKGAQVLRSRPRINSGTLYPSFCMETLADGANTVAGYDAVISPCVPDNITSSGTSGSLSGLIFGAFSESIRHLIWGDALECLVDPYSLGSQSEIVLYTFLSTDIIIPRPSLLNLAFFS